MSMQWIFIRRIAMGSLPSLRPGLLPAEPLAANAS